MNVSDNLDILMGTKPRMVQIQEGVSQAYTLALLQASANSSISVKYDRKQYVPCVWLDDVMFVFFISCEQAR